MLNFEFKIASFIASILAPGAGSCQMTYAIPSPIPLRDMLHMEVYLTVSMRKDTPPVSIPRVHARISLKKWFSPNGSGACKLLSSKLHHLQQAHWCQVQEVATITSLIPCMEIYLTVSVRVDTLLVSIPKVNTGYLTLNVTR